MRAQSKDSHTIYQQKSKVNSNGFFKFHMLSKDESGKMVNLKVMLLDESGLEQQEQQDSMCCDSELTELLDGIVGILEGFGLLDYTTDENVEDKLSQGVAAVAGNPFDVKGKENFIKMISQQIARMPNSNQYDQALQEAAAKIEELISEYQCSFDNTNNTGVKGQEGQDGQDIQESLDGQDIPESPKDQSVQADKLMVMIKTAMDKAKGKGIQNERINFDKDKNAETEKTSGAVEKNENGAQVFKTSNTLNAEQTTATKETQQVSQADMADNIAEMAEKITLNRKDGKDEFDVTLKPGSLGKLSIKLIMDSDGIKAHIKASDQFVKGLIAEQLPELSQMLKDKGVNMQHIEVVYDNPMFSSTDQHFNGQNPDTGNAGRAVRSMMAAHKSDDNAVYDVISDQTDLYIRNSSVEFSA